MASADPVTVTVTADSPTAVTYPTSAPTVGYTTNPALIASDWTLEPSCAIYDISDTSYTNPLSGILDAGSYATQCAGGALADSEAYSLDPPGGYTAGTFTVDPAAAVHVAADTKTFTFGGTPPALTYTPSGFVNSESFGSTGMTVPTCSAYGMGDVLFASPLTLSSATNAGTYTIHCAGAVTSDNYQSPVTYQDATLTVDPATVGPSYTGPQWVTTTGTTASTNLMAAVSPALAGCPLSITLDPVGGGATLGPYSGTTGASGGVSLSATGLPLGIYNVTVTASGDCTGTDNTGVLSVVAASLGRGSNGGGWYKATTTPPRVNLGYQVQVRAMTPKSGPTTTTTQGQVLWTTNAGWRLKSGFNYSTTDGTTAWGKITCPVTQPDSTAWPFTPGCGQINYTGVLQSRDPVTGLWVNSSYGTVRFSLTVYDGGQATVCKKTTCATTSGPDWAGMRMWTGSGVPITTTGEPTLGVSAPIKLSGGQVKVF